MAARLNARHQEMVRDKIKASQLINRVQNHALGRLKKPMLDSQVRAAMGLLAKCVPDLSSVDHSGEMTYTYAPKPIPVEQRDVDSVESAARPATNGHTPQPH